MRQLGYALLNTEQAVRALIHELDHCDEEDELLLLLYETTMDSAILTILFLSDFLSMYTNAVVVDIIAVPRSTCSCRFVLL